MLWVPFVLSFTAWLVPRPAVAQATCDVPWEEQDLVLEGRIGTKDIRMRLGGAPDNDPDRARNLSGEFNYGTRWSELTEFTVEGVFAPDCSIRMNELDSMRRTTGTWRLRFAPGARFEGTRTDAATRSTAPITLGEAPTVDCSGRGPWRPFRSTRWPITFSYPANWQLTEDEAGIELLCPTPERLIYGGRPIRLEFGDGVDLVAAENAREGITAGRFFVRFPPDPWVIGNYDCGEKDSAGVLNCRPTSTGRRLGMTVAYGSGGEDRLYTRHGYVGQGGGSIMYLFLLGSRWVTLWSHDLPNWPEDYAYKSGPARFDGTGVTERLVRSVRPRAARPTRPPSAPR